MAIGLRMKERRKELKMTLEDVAIVTGVSRQTIQRYESGVISNIPSDKIELVAKALKTTPAYLMGWEETENDGAEERIKYYQDELAGELAQEMFDRPELKVLFDASRKASKEDIEQVASLLEKLSTK